MSNEGKIFLVDQGKMKLIPMVQTGYAKEDVLQVLLTQYPDLLPGDQINPEIPRRWLLVAREMRVPGDSEETGRWSLDHLFLDQDGVPTFVECKRAVDTRARREVVAQMLDYAANGIEYWSMDRLRQSAAETARALGQDLDVLVEELLDEEGELSVEDYWSTVETNLNSGRVRLIFVADEIPAELRRLVEFLNEKLEDVEVLAVEIRQFLGHDQMAMVPRVLGFTESARRKKSGGTRRHTNLVEFLSQLPSAVVPVFEQILNRAKEEGHTIYWGTKGFSIRAMLKEDQRLASFIYGWPSARLDFIFGYLPLAGDEEQTLRQKLLDFGLFTPSGEYRLKTPVTDANSKQILEMYEFVLQTVEKIVGEH